MMSTLWFLTDFGLQDAYVGIMKAVVKSISKNTEVHDLTHNIAPQQISQGAFVLEGCLKYLPRGAVVVAVVDPGVGSARKALAIRTQNHTFVGPDNGLLSPILRSDGVEEVVHLTDIHYWLDTQSDTFHGRDLFAPVGAHIAAGVPLSALGKPISKTTCICLPAPKLEELDEGHGFVGEVIYVDGFGNLVTSFPNHVVRESNRQSIHVGSHTISDVKKTFSDVAPGQFVVYSGSAGYLEIAVCNGNASMELQLGVGTSLSLVLQF